MRSDDKKRPVHLGFLTALGSPLHGLIGGFLVLNLAGRPVEFHCTAPVRPNRAQVILYGATLESFVCGEQIAPALVGRTKLDLAAILTNNPNMLTALRLLKAPLGLVFHHASEVETNSKTLQNFAEWDCCKDAVKGETEEKNIAGALAGVEEVENETERGKTSFYDSIETLPMVSGVDYSEWRETRRGKNRLALPVVFTSEEQGKISFDECVSRIEPFLKSIDSVEPFERIRLAVEEAQKSC